MEKSNKQDKRKSRIRHSLKVEGFRLSILRSNKYLFAQIIEMKTGKTVLGITDKTVFKDIKEKLTKVEKAGSFGEKFAKEALAKGIKEVVFDRGGYLYHGRVKSFAEGARKGGLIF